MYVHVRGLRRILYIHFLSFCKGRAVGGRRWITSSSAKAPIYRLSRTVKLTCRHSLSDPYPVQLNVENAPMERVFALTWRISQEDKMM